jgi:hypothetical protein
MGLRSNLPPSSKGADRSFFDTMSGYSHGQNEITQVGRKKRRAREALSRSGTSWAVLGIDPPKTSLTPHWSTDRQGVFIPLSARSCPAKSSPHVHNIVSLLFGEFNGIEIVTPHSKSIPSRDGNPTGRLQNCIFYARSLSSERYLKLYGTQTNFLSHPNQE